MPNQKEEKVVPEKQDSDVPSAVPRAGQAANEQESEIFAGLKSRLSKGDNKFTHRFHNLIADSNFIKLCHGFEKDNIFSIVGRTQQENWHSSFIAWILNPKGSHDLGHFPLRCLLTSINVLAQKQENFDKSLLPEDRLIDIGDFSDTVVNPESGGGSEEGEKQVYYGDRYKQNIKFDIAISTVITAMDKTPRRLVLICENKVGSPEGQAARTRDPQTKMYADFWWKPPKGQGKGRAFYPINVEVPPYPDDIEPDEKMDQKPAEEQNSERTPEVSGGSGARKPKREKDLYPHLYTQNVKSRLALLFLTAKKGVTAKDPRFINMDYSTLYEYVLLPALNHPNISSNAKRYLQEYIDLLETKGYIESEERKQLLYGIFQNEQNKAQKNKALVRQYLSYKLFSKLFFNDNDKYAMADLLGNWDVYKNDILEWLHYFGGIESFYVHQTNGTKEFTLNPHVVFGSKDDSASTNSRFIGVGDNKGVEPRLGNNFISFSGNKEYPAENGDGGDGAYVETFKKPVVEAIKSYYKKNKADFEYIRDIENKYGETISYLVNQYVDYYSENDPLVSAMVNRVQKSSRDEPDRSYLRDQLTVRENDYYPVLYFKSDKERKYPIYIKIARKPLFAEKSEFDKRHDNNESCDDIWISGSQICRQIASHLHVDEDKSNEDEKSGYTWIQHLKTYDEATKNFTTIPKPANEID